MRTPSFMPYAAGLAATLILSGCAAEEVSLAVPTSVTTPSSRTAEAPSTTPATTVDPVVARIPQAARADTQEGAEAFAKFFYEQVAKSWMKADPALLDGLYTKDCKTCLAFVETAETLREDEERYVSNPAKVQASSAYSFLPEKKHIAVYVDVLASKIVTKDGRVVERIPAAGEHVFVLTVEFDKHWIAVRSQVEKDYS